MFEPRRFGDYLVYDLNRLLRPRSVDELRVSVEAVRRVSSVFCDYTSMGEERQPGVLWVPAKEFYEFNSEVRLGLATDIRYLRKTADRFEHHLERFRTALDGTAPEVSPQSLSLCLERGADASAWFALNWLNPHQHVRMAIAFAIGGDAVEAVFREAIVVRGSSLFLREFQHSPRSARTGQIDKFSAPAWRIDRTLPVGLEKVMELLTVRAGERAAELFLLQVTFLRLSVQIEEERRRLQQSLYRILQDAWDSSQICRSDVSCHCAWLEFRS
jgi:hypothetical protein